MRIKITIRRKQNAMEAELLDSGNRGQGRRHRLARRRRSEEEAPFGSNGRDHLPRRASVR
jgi:hypothetical protein